MGASLDTPVVEIVQKASIYYLVPWTFAFILSPIALVWLSLRDAFHDLGGTAISRTIEIVIFTIFFGIAWQLNLISASSNNWPAWEYALVAAMEASVPTGIVLVVLAYRRRWALRRAVAPTAIWNRKHEPKQRSIWKDPSQMNEADFGRIKDSFRNWGNRK